MERTGIFQYIDVNQQLWIKSGQTANLTEFNNLILSISVLQREHY